MSYGDSEFTSDGPMPRKGLTSIEAEQLLRCAFPEVAQWLCWEPDRHQISLGVWNIPVGKETEGHVAEWSWRRAPIDYPFLGYCSDQLLEDEPRLGWSGAIEVTGASGDGFILFSYLSSLGTVGHVYLTSCMNPDLLRQFAADVAGEFEPCRKELQLTVFGGEDIWLAPETKDEVLLPSSLRDDIIGQVEQFFSHPGRLAAAGLPLRRGFLFVGPPGNGKTMLSRELVRMCILRFGIRAVYLMPDKIIDEDMMAFVFRSATKDGPAMVILEDLESLINECDLTRAGFLGVLDGLNPSNGLLILATTNNPEQVDPALIHRPSRFDRVWYFDLPNKGLRRRYLNGILKEVDHHLIDWIVERTGDWSFAYLKELRTTAFILACPSCRTTLSAPCLVRVNTSTRE